MAAEVALKESIDRADPDYDVGARIEHGSKDVFGDNDNDTATPTELSSLDLSALVRQAAWGLVEHHQKGNPVEIRARGTSESVFESLTNQFMAFGTSRVIAEHLAQALVDETINRANDFRSKVKQNYIAVSAIVADAFREDMYQFETGHTEVIVIDKDTADIAGSSGQEVRLTATGTATTSNRADVGQIFASVRKWGLYIIEEAPGKEEIDALDAQVQAALAAIGTDMAAGMDGEGLRAVIEQLKELGALTPEIESMLATLVVMSEYAALEQTPEVQKALAELSEKLMEQMAEAIEGGIDVPLPLLQGMAEYLNNLAESHDLEASIDMSALSELRQDIKIEVLKSDLQALAETLDGDAKAELQDLIDQLDDLDGKDLAVHLQELQAHLDTLGLSAEQLAAFVENIQDLKAMVVQSLPLEQKMEFLGELAAEDLLALIQELDGLDPKTLPPELAEILAELTDKLEAQGLNIQDLSIEQFKEILAEKGELATTVQNLILALNDPDIRDALPQAALDSVNNFLETHSEFVQAVSTQAVITDLQVAMEALAEADPDSPETAKQIKEIQEIIDRLQNGEKLDSADPATLSVLAETLGEKTPPAITEAITALQNTSVETSSLDTNQIAALESFVDSNNLSAEQTQTISEIVQNPQNVTPTQIQQAVEMMGQSSPPALIAAAQVASIPDLPAQDVQKITTALLTNDVQTLQSAAAENQAVLKALPPAVQTQIVTSAIQTILPDLGAQNPKIAASVQTLLEAQKPDSPVTIHPAKLEMLKRDIAKADLPPAQAQAIQNLIDASANNLNQTPPTKPGCSPICNCHNEASKPEGGGKASDITQTRDGDKVITTIQTVQGEVKIERTQADLDRINEAYERIEHSGLADKTGEVSSSQVEELKRAAQEAGRGEDQIIRPTEAFHVCGPGCNHGPDTSQSLTAEAIDTNIDFGFNDTTTFSNGASQADASSLFGDILKEEGIDTSSIKSVLNACADCGGCGTGGGCGSGEGETDSNAPKNDVRERAYAPQ